MCIRDRFEGVCALCHTDDASSGRSPDRHQASREVCGEEGRTIDAHICDRKSAGRLLFEKQWKTIPNQAKIAPESVPGLFWGPSAAQRSPQSSKSTPKGIPRRPKGARWGPQGRPKSVQGFPKSAQREPRSAFGRSRESQNHEKVGHRGEKSRF